MTEAAMQRATKRKMKILTHKYVIRKVMLLQFCFVMTCPYRLLDVAERSYFIIEGISVPNSHNV
jgi:hypothetical protein